MKFRLVHYALKNRSVIKWFTIAVLVISIVIVIFSERQYRTEALLMPPERGGMEGLLTSWISSRGMNLPSMVLPQSAGASSAAILVDILESRRLAEMIIRPLRLKEEFKVTTMQEAVQVLHNTTSVSVYESGLIKLSVEYKDPGLASRIAGRYISGLDSINYQLESSRASSTMDFISGQLKVYRQRLEKLRKQIAGFQEEHGIINFDKQVEGAIDVASNLRIRTALAGIEYNLLKEFATSDAVELESRRMEYNSLREQLRGIMKGDTTSGVFFPLGKMPELHRRYAAMQRDLEVAERVYSVLLQRYEQAGIEKARNTPSIQVIDQPVVPAKPAGIPQWGIILILTAGGWLWISILVMCWGWVSMSDKSPEDQKALDESLEIIKSEVDRLRKLFRI